MSKQKSFAVCGLPASGKTTFLAAFWHLVESEEIATALRWVHQEFPEFEYANDIRDTWLSGREQDRTTPLERPAMVGFDLVDEDGNRAQLIFPDHSGETFSGIWKDREIYDSVLESLTDRDGLLVFVNANKCKLPKPLETLNDVAEKAIAKLPIGDIEEEKADDIVGIDWVPDESPDQVRLVDILQALCRPPLVSRDRKLTLFLSAWDEVESLGLSPDEFLATRLPLLDQYLRYGNHPWTFRVYGLSAQGCAYLPYGGTEPITQELAKVVGDPVASKRIRLVNSDGESHDLTSPLAWMML